MPGAIAIPAITGMVSNPAAGTLPLTLFCGSSFAMVTFYGGLMSVAPAYVGDLFGAKHQSPIFGRLLTAWSSAAICGPILLTTLRSRSYEASANDLAAQIDPAAFESTFGAPVGRAAQRCAARSSTAEQCSAERPPLRAGGELADAARREDGDDQRAARRAAARHG